MKSAYTVKIEFKEDVEKIKKKLIETAEENLMDFSKERPWKGFKINKFMLENTGKRELFYGYDPEARTLHVSYGFEEQIPHERFDGKLEYHYKRNDVDVWFDFQSKLIILFVSDPGQAYRVLNLLTGELDD